MNRFETQKGWFQTPLLMMALLLAVGAQAQDGGGTPNAAAAAAGPPSISPPAADFAILGVTVHPLDRPAEKGVTVVVQDGRITAIGPLLAAPPDTTVFEMPGKNLFPGFVHAFSTLGLVEIGSVRGTRDVNEIGENNADLRAEVAWNADSLRLPPSVRGGVLTAHIRQSGGVFSGTTAVMRMAGWNWQDMTMDAPTGMVLEFPQVAAGGDDDEDEESGEALKALNEMVGNVQAYAKARAVSSPGLDRNPKLEALIPVFKNEQRLFIVATGGRTQIEAALDWAEKQELENVVLVSNYEARYVKKRLAESAIPVILTSVLAMPSRDWEPYDAAYSAPAALHEAGVTFAIAGEGNMFANSNSRNLPFHAAMAAAFGLPKNIALQSVTSTPAEILGIADRVGSIEINKDATFFIASTDTLEIVNNVEHVWIAGEKIDLDDDHQYRLYQKYWNRPRPEDAAP